MTAIKVHRSSGSGYKSTMMSGKSVKNFLKFNQNVMTMTPLYQRSKLITIAKCQLQNLKVVAIFSNFQ